MSNEAWWYISQGKINRKKIENAKCNSRWVELCPLRK